jgi:arsenical pump membrane protein
VRRLPPLIGAVAVAAALVADHREAVSAASRTWPPFVLVVGLLLVGRVAFEDGLFDRAAALTARVRGGAPVLFVVLLGLVAVVTAVLNLDTAVVFLTPVLVLAARRRGLPEEPFLYGALFMANSASLLLPGSNLTNLLVLARQHVSGGVFAGQMLPAWLAAVAVTLIVVGLWHRTALTGPGPAEVSLPPAVHPGLVGVGVGVTAAAAALVLALRAPALPVLVLGVAAVTVTIGHDRRRAAEVVRTLDLPVVVGLFGIAVALGTLAGDWSGPSRLLQSAGTVETAAVGAVAAVVVNNLPAAVLLSARAPVHPHALLVGLDLGPNLAVSGSLSALLWYRAARAVGARPSLLRVSTIGLVLVPCSMAAALGALAVL